MPMLYRILLLSVLLVSALTAWAQSSGTATTSSKVERPSEDDLLYDPSLKPPAGVSASDGKYPDKVFVYWEEGVKGMEYKLYKATSDTPSRMRPVEDKWSNITYMTDRLVQPGVRYYYRVKGRIGEKISDFSTADIGFIPRGSGKAVAEPRDTSIITRDSIQLDTTKNGGEN